MNYTNGLGMYGIFSMTVRVDGKQTLRIVKRNQITNEGRTAAVQLLNPYLSSSTQQENRLWSLAVGTNGTPPTLNDTADLLTPGGTNAVWTSPFDFNAGECITYNTPPDKYEVVVTKTLPASAVPGEIISEAGLFTRGNNDDPTVALNRKLYARQIHSPITKEDNMSIEYSWTLGFNVSTT